MSSASVRRKLPAALVALAMCVAAAIVVGPRLVSAIASSSPQCIGASDVGVISIGQGVGSGVVAMNIVPGSAPNRRLSVEVRDIGTLSQVPTEVWISGPGATHVALTRSNSECWTGSAPASTLTRSSVHLRRPSLSPITVPFQVPVQPESGASVLARAARHTLQLGATGEITGSRPSLDRPVTTISSTYIGNRVTSRSQGAVQILTWPGWRAGFEWVSPGIGSSVLIGPVQRGQRHLVRVAGVVIGAPLWMVLDIDPTTGEVVWDRMSGPHHEMTNELFPLSVAGRTG